MSSLLAFAAFAAVLTVTPGLDTMLVLRTAAADGRRAALAAGAGILLGCLCWALASALGITAVLTASRLAYDVLRLAGAGYLCWLGVRLLARSRRHPPGADAGAAGAGAAAGAADAGAGAARAAPTPGRGAASAFRIGLTTNLLNPKVGVFYLSVLPQFLPDGMAALVGSTLLGVVHVAEGLVWFALIVAVVGRARAVLARPGVRRRLDQLTGLLFVGLGVRLAVRRG